MKKIISIFLTLFYTIFALTACESSSGEVTETPVSSDDKIKIVTTIFPEYDWVKQILGDRYDSAEVTLLLDDGVDLHSYQPTASDILKIADCDLFIYVGGHSDTWVDDALQASTNNDMVTINLCEVLSDSLKQEEQIEGMENSHANEHAGEESGEDHHHDDEHVWLSLKNAQVLCSEIANALGKIDPDYSEVYEENCKTYNAKLDELDKQYRETVDGASGNTLLFGDRFPFRYMVDDYGLNYYAAFTGCSAESEASFETITFLAGKVDELNLPVVLTIENSNLKIAKTIIENTESKDQEIMAMDSMQSTTSEDIKNGANYLAVMKNNLSVLKEALR